MIMHNNPVWIAQAVNAHWSSPRSLNRPGSSVSHPKVIFGSAAEKAALMALWNWLPFWWFRDTWGSLAEMDAIFFLPAMAERSDLMTPQTPAIDSGAIY